MCAQIPDPAQHAMSEHMICFWTKYIEMSSAKLREAAAPNDVPAEAFRVLVPLAERDRRWS